MHLFGGVHCRARALGTCDYDAYAHVGQNEGVAISIRAFDNMI
jgi:hypothetical protein